MMLFALLGLILVSSMFLLVRDYLLSTAEPSIDSQEQILKIPEAFRQCVETQRNTSVEIRLTGRSFLEIPLWYGTVSVPSFGVLIDEDDAILVEPTVLKHKNKVKYTPEREFVGTDRFHFIVFDGEISEVEYVVIKVTDRKPMLSASQKQEAAANIGDREANVRRILEAISTG